MTSFSQAAGSNTPLVGTHSPGRFPAVKLNVPNRWSSARAANRAVAAATPVAIPPSFAGPGSIPASVSS